MIVEGIVTTRNANGLGHVTPMGPLVIGDFSALVLRPFQTSTTFHNLQRTGVGVFHTTDDVDILARAAIGRLDPLPAFEPMPGHDAFRLADCCRWFLFHVKQCDAAHERANLRCEIVNSGRVRDFLGFNRAKHAVVEAAILATRLAILPREEILREFQRLGVIVEKTAGDQERQAFALLAEFVQQPPGPA